MESSTEDTKEAEVVEAAMTEDAAAEGTNNEDAKEEPEPSKNDIGCKDCLQESGQAPSKELFKQENHVRFNDVVETHEVETEYDKPDRLGAYMKGFGKRVIICTILVMFGKTAWPHIQPIVWPEAPTKEGKLYVLTDKSFRGHVSRGDHFIMMYAPWCGHCKNLKPEWEKLAKQTTKGASISKMDCTTNKITCEKYEVKGYPTLIYMRNGKVVENYKGDKTLKALKEYVNTMRTTTKYQIPNPGDEEKKKSKTGSEQKKKSTSKKKKEKTEL